MDRGKKSSKFLGGSNNKICLDLKSILRENALPFLPAKSLFRFQAVCRDWKICIPSPFFAHNQSLSFRTISGLFCQVAGEPPTFISLDKDAYGVPDPFLTFLPEPVNLRASSNGLICCQSRIKDKAYYIVNPVTKQFKKLLKPNANHGHDPAIVLIFKPSLLNFVADYKLVCAFPSADFDDACEFEIYSSTEGSWRISGEILFGNRNIQPRSGVHVDGMVYWIGKLGMLVAFDVENERSQLVYGANMDLGSLGVMDGKLCMVHVNRWEIIVNVLSNAYTNTMEMDTKVRAWEEKPHIPLPVRDQVYQKMVLFAGGDVVVFQSGDEVLCYDMKAKELKVVGSAPRYDTRFIPYVNSLVYF